MTAPLAHDFALMSDLSRRPPHAVPVDEQRLELAEEERHRRQAYPRFVREGRMSQEEADRHFAIIREIGRDVAAPPSAGHAIDAWWEERLRRQAAGPFTWEDKVRELRRELAIRRNRYPTMVKRLTADERDLAQRMERLEAVHFDYWLRFQHIAADPGEDRAEFRDRLRRLSAARDHWVASAVAAGERAIDRWQHGHEIASWYRAGGREQLLRELPDIQPPALDAAA